MEERLRWQGSSREAGKADFDTLGSDVWLEQFRYGVHGLYWFAILTRVITACWVVRKRSSIGWYHKSPVVDPMSNHKSEGDRATALCMLLQRLAYPTQFADVNAIWTGEILIFANNSAWRWSQAVSTSFPDSSSNGCDLKVSKARNKPATTTMRMFRVSALQDSGYGILWSCIINDGQLGKDVVSTWMACSSEERLLDKVVPNSLGSEQVSRFHAGDNFRVLATFFRLFLAFISSRMGRKLRRIQK